jgi:hypothetical protein
LKRKGQYNEEENICYYDGLKRNAVCLGCGKKSVADELNAQNDSPAGTAEVQSS